MKLLQTFEAVTVSHPTVVPGAVLEVASETKTSKYDVAISLLKQYLLLAVMGYAYYKYQCSPALC